MSDVDVAAKFNEAEISPSIISAPKQVLEVKFGGKSPLNFGDVLHVTDVKHAPAVTFKVNPGSMYSLVMIDPDNLSRANPSEAEWLHWLSINIPADALINGTIPKPIMGYSGPSPQPRTGQHRYVLLLFEHSGRRLSQPAIKTRAKFKVKEFAVKHKLGDPVAGNYFIAQHDSQ